MKTPPMTDTPRKTAIKTATKTAAKSPAKSPAKRAATPVARTAAKKAAVKKAAPKKPAAKPAPKPAPNPAPKAANKAPAKAVRDPSDALADLAVAALEDLKGVDIKRLDVRGLTTITDVMLIATGTSNRHASALAHNVVDKVKQAGHRPVGIEGLNEGEWVLVNLGGVIVHVMQAQARAFYQLEKLWDLSAREPFAGVA